MSADQIGSGIDEFLKAEGIFEKGEAEAIREQAEFRKSLAETVAWCALQPIVGDPTEEFARRKELSRQSQQLFQRANLLEQRGTLRRWAGYLAHKNPGSLADLRRKAGELSRAGDLTPILPLNHQLRASALRPKKKLSTGVEYARFLPELCAKRAELLHQRNAYPEIAWPDSKSGKLLFYEPEDNVADGASQYLSMGHFDLRDAPPWDTWVAFVGRTLISWVPSDLIQLVQRGIDVNVVDCVHWAWQ